MVENNPDSAVVAPPALESVNPGEPSIATSPSLIQPDADNPPWGILQAFLVWLMSVILLLLPQLFALPYVAIHYQGMRPTIEMLLADKTFILILVIGILPVHLITLGVAWAVITRLGRYSAGKVLGWSWPANFSRWQSAGLAVVLFGLAWIIVTMFGGQETDLERMLQSSRAAALITAFIAVATAPLVEEVIYRGLLYSALQRVFGAVPSIVIVAVLFAGLHVPQYWPNIAAIGSIALLSVGLTVVRARTGRILPSFVIHTIFNGIQSVLIVAEPYIKMLADAWSRKAATSVVVFVMHFLR